MEHATLPPLSRFAICGGTHGNEMSGVYMIREMQKQKADQKGSISIETVLTNPRAVDVCRRYIDTDLNRCFTDALLRTPITDSSPYELSRALELSALLGPKGSENAVDLLCDLHNTTSNMGLCLIFYSVDWLTLHIYKYLQMDQLDSMSVIGQIHLAKLQSTMSVSSQKPPLELEESRITSAPVTALQLDIPKTEAYSLESVGKRGFAFEVGPQPNGVVRADIFNIAKEAVDLTIEWLQRFNSGETFAGGEVEAYTPVKTIDYPRDPTTNEITAAIHPQLQDNDFKLLKPGDPTFLSFSGETVKYQGEALYPFFINECAYYEKKIAFQLAKKVTLTFPSISVKKD